jgi:8-oxo-dGTP diphosphatase
MDGGWRMKSSKVYTPIVGTLGYVVDHSKEKVLMVHRNARKSDQHLGKYNGLGGKLEKNEDPASGMKREIKEEAGIDVIDMKLKGVINWTGFGPNGEDWLGFIFYIHQFEGKPFIENEEGDLSWEDISKLHKLPMWEGDKHFLPLVFDEDPRVFYGYMPYENAKPIDWSFVRH